MKLYAATPASGHDPGTPVDIPDADVPAAIASRNYGLPEGGTIPVQHPDGKMAALSVEDAHAAFQAGARAVPQSALEAYELQGTHGGAGQQALTAVEQGLGGATLGAAPAIEGAILGNSEDILKREKANPITAAGANVVGAVAPMFIPGAEELSVGEEASALGTLGRAIGAPTRAAGAVSSGVGGFVREALGASEADSFVTALAKSAAAHGAEGATWGAITGATEHLSEESLGDPAANGESLLAATGHGALLGLTAGAGLGAAGELGSQVLGRLAPSFAHGAEEAAVRAVSPGAERVLADLPGGVRAAGRRMLDDGLVKAGDTSADIAAKLPKAADEAEARAVKLLEVADADGSEGVRVKPIVEAGEKEIERLADHPEAAGALRRQLDRIERQAGIPRDVKGEELSELFGVEIPSVNRGVVLDSANLRFQDAANLIGTTEGPLKGILRAEFDAAGERASKRLGGSFTEAYDDATLAAKQYRALASAPPHAGKPFNWGAAGLGLLTHGPIGAGAGIALGLAKRWASERGLSTAATVMDKLSVLRGIEQAAQRTNREIARGVDALVGTGKRAEMNVGRVTHAAGVDAYEARVEAVQRAARDPGGAAEAAAAGLEQHAPKVAAAFQAAAVRATQYLAKQIPPPPPQPHSLTPQFAPKHSTDLQARAKWMREFDAVHDPKTVLHAAASGTVTPDMVAAASHTHPALWAKVTGDVRAKLGEAKRPLTDQQRMSVSVLLGVPATDPSTARAYQQTFTDKTPPGGVPTQNQDEQHRNKGRYGNAPKRPITATAKNVALSVGRPQGT